MSFREKSAWACLLAIVFVFVPYFWLVFTTPGYPIVITAFIGAVVGLTTILAAAHLVFALCSARIRRTGDAPAADERELGVELRSTKIAAYTLSLVVMTWCLAAYAGIPLARITQHRATEAVADVQRAVSDHPDDQGLPERSLSNLLPVPAHDAIFFVHVLFAGFVLTNVVYYAALVLGYRRSV